jgi:hypothetical protein
MEESKWLKLQRGTPTARYREVAQRLFHQPRGDNFDVCTVEVRDHADVTSGSNPGAWVEAWVWIPARMIGVTEEVIPPDSGGGKEPDAVFDSWWQRRSSNLISTLYRLEDVRRIAREAYELGLAIGKGHQAAADLGEAMRELAEAQQAAARHMQAQATPPWSNDREETATGAP